MEKINVKQLQDVVINEEKVSVGEALQGFANFADVIYGEVETLGTKVEEAGKDIEDKVSNERLDDFKSSSEGTKSLETWSNEIDGFAVNVIQGMEGLGEEINNLPYTYATKAQLADYVANQRLDEFNPDDSATDGTLEKWAGDVEEASSYLEDQVGMIASDATNLWGEFRKQESRLDNFAPNSSATAGTIEKWASTVGGGGLPEVTPEDAGKYFKVDENGNVITYEPADSIGDGDFYGNPDSFVTAEAIVELVQQYYDFITGGSEVTEGCLGTKVQEIKERLEDFIDNEIIMGDPIHFTSDPDNHNLIDGTYEITGVNRVDVIRIRELNTGAFDDLIGITFLNLEDYPSWRPEGADFMMQMLNAERTRWKIEYGDTYYGDPVAWDVELIPYEVRKRIPNSNESGYQILEELHRESW